VRKPVAIAKPIAILSLCRYAGAQSPAPSTINGQIVDAGGAAIVGARIEARQLDGSFDVRLVSDQEGRYILSNLPPGRYEIHVDHAGFRDLKQEAQAQAGSSIVLNLALAVSSFTENVTVNTQSPLVTETPTGQTQASVSREDFRNTPAATIGEPVGLYDPHRGDGM
jgi:hypothetical protein